MLKNISSFAVAALTTTAFIGTVSAQGEEDPFAEDMAMDDPVAEPQPAAPTTSSDDDGGDDFYKLAISTAFPTGGSPATADLLYGLDADTYLDLKLGFSFAKVVVPDPMDSSMTNSESTVGMSIGVGYRMYKPTEGKIRPYLEPIGRITVADFSDAGNLGISMGAIMGVDYALMDQFTLGVGVGAALEFSDEFDTIQFGLLTTTINATFWW